jgi:hypothetical protein
MKREITLKEALSIWKEHKKTIVRDFAVPKTATTKFTGVMNIITEGGKYLLTLTENIDEPDKGLITVEVNNPYKDELEGRCIQVVNKKGDVLLKGKITSGRVAQKVEKIQDIDLNQIFIKPTKEF